MTTALGIIGYIVCGVLTAYVFVKTQNPRSIGDYGHDTGPDIVTPFVMALLWPVVIAFVICAGIWLGFGILLHKIAGNS